MGRLEIVVLAVALGGCATTKYIDREVPKEVLVEVRAPCPDKDEAERLKDGRPVPLRKQRMPDTAEERTAAANAQLGRYEAEGGWADQVVSALDRCQS